MKIISRVNYGDVGKLDDGDVDTKILLNSDNIIFCIMDMQFLLTHFCSFFLLYGFYWFLVQRSNIIPHKYVEKRGDFRMVLPLTPRSY